MSSNWTNYLWRDAGSYRQVVGRTTRPVRLEVCYHTPSERTKLTKDHRWLFVVNAIITVLQGAAGYFMIPDYPNNPNPRAVWFKRVHAELAMHRLDREGRVDIKPITWTAAKYLYPPPVLDGTGS